MKVLFTSTIKIDDLWENYNQLSMKLPCTIEPIFDINPSPRNTQDVAVAFYNESDIKNGYPTIEVNSEYFSLSILDRKLILFHEIIHACQRANDLASLNKKYFVDELKKWQNLETKYGEQVGRDSMEFALFQKKLYAINMFATWIFEIWDEMYLQKNHAEFFEYKMKITYNKLKTYYKPDVYSFLENWAKYAIFIEIIRSRYSMKMTSGTQISADYEDLYNKWLCELKRNTDNKEFEKFMNLVEPLTNITAYEKSDTKILEVVYDPMIDTMIQSLGVSVSD